MADQPLESLGDDQGDDRAVPSPSDYADPGENPKTGVAKKGFWPQWMKRLVSRRQPVQNFDQAMAAHSLKVEQSNLNFRRVYAFVLLIAMVIQVGVADWFFYLYLRAYEFRAPEQTMSVWIGAAVVQLIGLVAIITKYLFPNSNKD